MEEPLPIPRQSTVNLYLLMAKQAAEDEEWWRRTLDDKRHIALTMRSINAPLAQTDDSLASLKAAGRTDRTDHLLERIEQVRSDLHRKFDFVQAEAHRDFRMAAAIQLTTLAAIMGVLAALLSR